MEVKINTKNDNKLLHRTELNGTLSFQGPTPSYKDLAKSLSNTLKTSEELIIVKHIYTDFGNQSATFEACAYENKEKLVNVERIKEEVKKEGETTSGEEAKPAEVASE